MERRPARVSVAAPYHDLRGPGGHRRGRSTTTDPCAGANDRYGVEALPLEHPATRLFYQPAMKNRPDRVRDRRGAEVSGASHGGGCAEWSPANLQPPAVRHYGLGVRLPHLKVTSSPNHRSGDRGTKSTPLRDAEASQTLLIRRSPAASAPSTIFGPIPGLPSSRKQHRLKIDRATTEPGLPDDARRLGRSSPRRS